MPVIFPVLREFWTAGLRRIGGESARASWPNIFEIFNSRGLVGGVAKRGCNAAGVAIGEDECSAFDAVEPLPVDRKGRSGFLDVERFGVALAGEPERQVIFAVDDQASPVSVENSVS